MEMPQMNKKLVVFFMCLSWKG